MIGDPDYGASVSQISEQEAERDLLSGLAPYDICGDRWDPRAVLRRMDELATRENGEPRAISDVLSDQRIFAGLGNTLKIEAMFALRLFPRRCVRDIPTAVRIELIDWVRDCAMRWLALKQHFRDQAAEKKMTSSATAQLLADAPPELGCQLVWLNLPGDGQKPVESGREAALVSALRHHHQEDLYNGRR